ncbi:MAG: PQQ-binding-like beta-propeller repeat protein [Pirellulales bacterium]
MRFQTWRPMVFVLAAFAWGLGRTPAFAEDQPQWGQRHSRNMVSAETGLPATFDPKTGQNVKWSIPLGTQTYSTPVIAGGRVLIGTNNERPRDRRRGGDRGVLMCVDEKDGRLLWQLVVPKLSRNYQDWEGTGICFPPTVEGDRVYVLTNRGEVACLDLNGQDNGNDGPFQDEARYLASASSPPPAVKNVDADIVWLFDLAHDLNVKQHDAAHCSILIDGSYLYVCTSNGVDDTHRHIPAPEAPSLVVLDKESGRFVARENEGIGKRTVHCTWSSPSVAEIGGRRLVFFGGGDGVCYAFEALVGTPPAAAKALTCAWRFDCDPTAPKRDIYKFQGNREISPSSITGMPVAVDGRVYITVGGDIWHGKRQSWLKCVDAASASDAAPRELWSFAMKSHCVGTPAVYRDLAFVGDCGRMLHCVDATTGVAHWKHVTHGELWGSPLVADGKVFVGTRKGDFWVLAAEKQKRILHRADFGEPIHASPVAANKTLYVATMTRLYAIRQEDPARKSAPD